MEDNLWTLAQVKALCKNRGYDLDMFIYNCTSVYMSSQGPTLYKILRYPPPKKKAGFFFLGIDIETSKK